MQIVLLRNVFGWGEQGTHIHSMRHERTRDEIGVSRQLRHRFARYANIREALVLYQARRGRNGRAMYEEVLRKRFEDQDSENLHGGSRHKSASNSFETH